MAKKKDDPRNKLIASNKKARHDYNIIDEYECGMVLTGTEVKSLRQGRASLVDGFAQVTGGEMWLHNVHIMEYAQGTWTNHAARRNRKLLLHRWEIQKLEQKLKETGYTLVPLSLYFKDGRAKVNLALAQGKKLHDKRQTLREQQDRRETDRAVAAARRRQR
jgi:SsrA-binding protein